MPENVLHLIVPWTEEIDFKLDPHSPLIAEKVAPVAANIHLKTGTKAEGIHKICASMRITAEQALAFGDEENDSLCLKQSDFLLLWELQRQH